MMRHRLHYAVAIPFFSLFALILLAGPKDFWEAKPYTEWSEKEVEKLLLKNSPWTQTLLPNPPSSAGQIGSTKSGGSSSMPPMIIINWFSRPIKEAAARQLMLRNPDTPKAQIDKMLTPPNPQFLEFLVTGISAGSGGRRGGGGGGGGAEMEKFKSQTYLQKKNSEKIPLANVVPPRGRDQAMILQFPREIDGKPVAALEDKEITLVIRSGDTNLKFKFKLSDMVIKDKLEI